MIAIPISNPTKPELSFSPLFGKASHVLLIDPSDPAAGAKIIENQERNGKALAQQIIAAGCSALLTHHLGEQAYANFQTSATVVYYIADIDLSIDQLLDGYRQNQFPLFSTQDVRPPKKRHLGSNCQCSNHKDPVTSPQKLKLAIPVTDGVVADHFGHCEYYALIEIENGIVKATENITAPEGCGCKSNIANLLAEKGISLMLAGNIGDGAFNKIRSQHIDVIRGCTGELDKLITQFINGEICDSQQNCDHSQHSHSCSH